MSVNDRRASYMNAPRPRVASNRVGDTEKPNLRGGASPLQAENMEPRGSTSSHKSKTPREHQNITSEKRTERMVIHSKEKAHVRTRNPVKESSSAGNRGEWERSRSKRASQTDGASPNMRKKDKEQTEGE